MGARFFLAQFNDVNAPYGISYIGDVTHRILMGSHALSCTNGTAAYCLIIKNAQFQDKTSLQECCINAAT